MRLTEGCPCGATLIADSHYSSDVDARHRTFLAAHRPCRTESGRRQEFERLALERLDVLVGRTDLTVSLHLPEVVEFLARAAVYPDRSINDEPDMSLGVTVHNPEPECLPAHCCERHYSEGCHFIRCCPNCPSPPRDYLEGVGA